MFRKTNSTTMAALLFVTAELEEKSGARALVSGLDRSRYQALAWHPADRRHRGERANCVIGVGAGVFPNGVGFSLGRARRAVYSCMW
jgi:hypothetical protein